MAQVLLVTQSVIFMALCALIGQLLVGAFHWARRHDNVIWRFFALLTRPPIVFVRWLLPAVVRDRHVPAVTFLLLLIGYFALGFMHRDVCLTDLTQVGCERWLRARVGH